jgi:hypothetical protein
MARVPVHIPLLISSDAYQRKRVPISDSGYLTCTERRGRKILTFTAAPQKRQSSARTRTSGATGICFPTSPHPSKYIRFENLRISEKRISRSALQPSPIQRHFHWAASGFIGDWDPGIPKEWQLDQRNSEANRSYIPPAMYLRFENSKLRSALHPSPGGRHGKRNGN